MPHSFPSAAEAKLDLDPYLPFLRDVPLLAWAKAMAEGPMWVDTTTRKNMAWDAMCILAREKASEYGLKLGELRRGRVVPLVLAPGKRFDYAVRFNCLSDDHHAGGWHTGQRQMFEGQANGDHPLLPGFKRVIYLRAGYVLDEFGIAVARTPVVLSYHDSPLWAFDIDGGEQSAQVIPLQPKKPKPGEPGIASDGNDQKKDDTGTDDEQI